MMSNHKLYCLVKQHMMMFCNYKESIKKQRQNKQKDFRGVKPIGYCETLLFFYINIFYL
jgi:hypothetical protein